MENNTKPTLIYIRAASKYGKELQKDFIVTQMEGSMFHAAETVWDRESGVAPLSRPGLSQLFEAIKDSGVKDVIMDSPTRLSRRKLQLQKVVNDLASAGVQVHYAEDGLNSSSMKAFMLRTFRTYERKSHGERIKDAIRTRRSMQI